MNMTATTMQTRASASFGNVIVMTDARITRGQAAWSHIKATAEQQREAWRDIGEALLVGRKLHKSNKLFGQWVKDHGFGDMHMQDRHGAMWLAENWSAVLTRCEDKTLAHPRRIREFLMNEPEVNWEEKLPDVKEPEAPNVPDVSDIKPRPRLTLDAAKKINKLSSMAEFGEGNEKEVAIKRLKKVATTFGESPEELTERSRKADPLHGVSANQQATVEHNVALLAQPAALLVATLKDIQTTNPSITREYLMGLLDSVCDQLGVE